MRTLAVTNSKRVPELPDVPTFTESDLPGFEVVSWSGIYVPARTPRSIVNQLNARLTAWWNNPKARASGGLGLVPVGGTPTALGDHLKSEIARWAKVVKEAGINGMSYIAPLDDRRDAFALAPLRRYDSGSRQKPR